MLDEVVAVIGGGIAGIESSLVLSKHISKVYLLERVPTLGGNLIYLSKVFPTLDSSSKILERKFEELEASENVQVLTKVEIKSVIKEEDGFEIKALVRPRYVETNKCDLCGACSDACPVEYDREHELGIGKRRAIDVPSKVPFPRSYEIEEERCIQFKGEECKACVEACPKGAVNLEEEARNLVLRAKALIIATGMELFDLSKVKELGYGRYRDVINSLELERLLDEEGPTKGELIRPSDRKRPGSVAFVLCAGSRDRRFLRHCCNVGCMTALKQAYEIKELYGDDVEVFFCYNDVRANGRFHEEFYQMVRDRGLIMLRGLPSEIRKRDGKLILRVFDVATWKLEELSVDLVVLIPGLVSASSLRIDEMIGADLDEDTFFKTRDKLLNVEESVLKGVFLAGCSAGPMNIVNCVAHARAAAAKVLNYLSSGEKVNYKAYRIQAVE